MGSRNRIFGIGAERELRTECKTSRPGDFPLNTSGSASTYPEDQATGPFCITSLRKGHPKGTETGPLSHPVDGGPFGPPSILSEGHLRRYTSLVEAKSTLAEAAPEAVAKAAQRSHRAASPKVSVATVVFAIA